MKDPEFKNDPKYDVYFSERTYLNESEKEIAQQFDKAILTLAAGALALSLTFIKQISPYPKSGTLCLLVFAWIAFGASLLSTLISFLTSQAALRRQRKILEDDFFKQNEEKGEKQTEKKEENNWLGTCTNWLNWISIIFFIIGIFSLTIFSIFNITTKEEKEMAEQKKINESYVPPSKPVKPEERGYVPPPIPKKPPTPPVKPVKK